MGSELSLAEFMNYQEFLGGSQVSLGLGDEIKMVILVMVKVVLLVLVIMVILLILERP